MAFPQVKAILCEELDRRELSIEATARSLNVSKSAVAAWRAGQKTPSSANVKKLARLFYPEDLKGQTDFEFRLTLAVKTSLKKGPLTSLELGDKLRVATAHPDGGSQFHERFFRLVMAIAGIGIEPIRSVSMDLRGSLVREEVDIALGLMGTTDRTLALKFVAEGPIRLGINCCVLKKALVHHHLGIQELRGRVATGKDVLPIVMKHDVGGVYVLRTLGIPESRVLTVDGLDAKSYADRLMGVDYRDQIPVTVADDVRSLRILAELQLKGEPSTLVFSLTSAESVQGEKRDLPVFSPAISLRRSSTDVIAWLVDGCIRTLNCEIETVSDFYLEVIKTYEDLARRHLASSSETPPEQEVENWIRYSFRLSQELIDLYEDKELPWKAVLTRALQKRENNVPGTVRKTIGDVACAHLSQFKEPQRRKILELLRQRFNSPIPYDLEHFASLQELIQFVRQSLGK